jgi:CBS domain-containing protein
MTRSVVTVQEGTPFKELVRTMQEHRVSGVPVVDADGKLTGIVTEADLLYADRDRRDPVPHNPFIEWFIDPAFLESLEPDEDIRARDIMTRQVVTTRRDVPIHQAVRKMLHAEVKRLPVVDEDGRVVGIVSRRDVLRPYLRPDPQIVREISEDVIHRTMWMDPTLIDVEVAGGLVTLRGTVDRRSDKEILAALVRRVDGVVGVNDELGYRLDDREIAVPPPVSDLRWGENWVRSG